MNRIVAKKWIEAKTSLSDNTLTFSTIEGGDFRLSACLAVNDSANGGNLHIVVVWTDLYRTEGKASGNLAYNSSDALTFSQTVHALPNTEVYIQVNGDTPPGGSEFSFYAVIEELSAPSLHN